MKLSPDKKKYIYDVRSLHRSREFIPYFEILNSVKDSKLLLFHDFYFDFSVIFNTFCTAVKNVLEKFYDDKYVVGLSKKLPNDGKVLLTQRPPKLLELTEQGIAGLYKIISLCYEILNKENSLSSRSHPINRMLTDLTCDIDEAIRILFYKYRTKISLMKPKHGFIIEDCFTPIEDECEGAVTIILTYLHQLALAIYAFIPVPVTISYRDEGFGAGAHFDHFNIQRITDRDTEISLSPHLDIHQFSQYLSSQQAAALPMTNTFFKRPKPYLTTDNPDDLGLLIIPGYSRNTPEKRADVHRGRIEYEKNLIFRALHLKQPVLAICGGLWTMLETFGGSTRLIRGHTGLMPRLSPQGALENVVNKHRILVDVRTQLASLMRPRLSASALAIAVTSIHWLATEKIPKDCIITAKAINEGKDFSEEGAIEAIEARDSPLPIIGVQWHPEVAEPTSRPDDQYNRNLIRNMADAGDIFHRRRIMLRELGVRHDRDESLTKLCARFGIVKINLYPEQAVKSHSSMQSLKY